MAMTELPLKIWVTGASTGIGAALARKLLQQGNEVIVTARNLANLQPLLKEFPERCKAVVVDLSDKEALVAAEKSLNDQVGYLDTLIINAGTCEYVDVKHFNSESFATVMDINFTGAVHTLELALPFLRRSPNQPYILGVSSMATVLPMPRSEAYGASKAALEYLLESLRVDLAAEGIDVSIVRPGFVKTPLTDRNDFAMPFIQTPQQAADEIAYGMARRKWIIQFPWQLVSIMTLCSWLPMRWQTALLKKMSRNKV